MSSNLQQSSSTSHPPSPLVWFLLLDSETGEPYKNTTTDYVSHPPGAVVAEFRKLVHRENSAILPGITPSQLLVYKNKVAFDSRSAAAEERNAEPLKSSHILDGLGETEEDALVVAVPPPSVQPSLQIHQPHIFPPCQVQFFNNICNATEIDCGSWITFEQNMPNANLNRLYIRESYRTIASRILEVNGIQKVIITGTPGIGKSLFLIYLLWQLVKERKRVLFFYHPYSIYYDENGGVFKFASDRLSLENFESFWNETLWCLFDAKFKEQSDLAGVPVGLSTFILSTSPRRDMVNDFKKPPVPDYFFMPIWTETELKAIAPLFSNSNDQWQHRFEILGGIPRHVLEVTRYTPREILEGACSECSLDDCIKKIGMDSVITDKSKVIHSLIHVESVHPFTTSSVRYASPTALNIIVQYRGVEAKHRMRALLASCDGNPLTAALCGYIFETYVIELLERGGTFPCRQLGSAYVQSIETSLNIPASEKIVIDSVSSNQTANQLYVPKTKNYAAIDAWMPGVGAFQITVGKNHGINYRPEGDLARLGEANRLYWMLPPEHYYSFTKNSPKSIEQYAVMIPYPE